MYRRLILFRRCAVVQPKNGNSGFASTSNAIGAVSAVSSHSSEKLKKINRAMLAYLENTRARETFLKKEAAEYELGKRHLANMMGMDASTMTKEDVNSAIAYLLPSSLFSPRSLPMMKAPEDLYPPVKPVQFDSEGRPFHNMFYTRMPNFYQILYDFREKILKLQAYEDHQYAKGVALPTEKLSLSGTDWLTAKQLSDLTLENITDEFGQQFVAVANDLLALPYSFLEAEFIKKYRAPMGIQVDKELQLLRDQVLSSVTVDENGRKTATATGYKHTSCCTVKLTDRGSGKIIIDGLTLDRFYFAQSRENVLFPFIILNRLGQFDVDSTSLSLTGEGERNAHSQEATGESVVCTATRHGISLALLAFVSPDEAEKMRLAGLLTRDPRYRERKKIGQPGARAKWIWKKR